MVSVLQIDMHQSFAEDDILNEESGNEMPEEQPEIMQDIQERLIEVGSGALSGTYSTGATGQTIITMTYTYFRFILRGSANDRDAITARNCEPN